MKFRRRCQLLNKPPDAVPLAGVFFLLLYFTLMRAPGVGVALPEMAGANLVPPGPVVAVAVDASGTLFFRNQIVTSEGLQAALGKLSEEEGADLTVLVQADKGLDYERILSVVRLARAAGVQRTLLAVRPPPTQPASP
tara:strand:- start:609 stop:1022 length:414 start_codon:yes stop_codon:yes gene_type:complete